MENLFESGNDNQQTTKFLSGFGNIFNNFSGGSVTRPLLPLPENFWNGGFHRTRFTFSSTTEALIPAADPILSEYGNEYMRLRFTAEYINFVNRQFSLFGYNYNEKFAYAIQMYRVVYGLVMIQIVEQSISSTLSFYLNFSINQIILETARIDKNPYINRLTRLDYPRENRRVRITRQEAANFLRIVDTEIDEHLRNFFNAANPAELRRKIEIRGGNYCGVNPVTRTPGINAVASGILGELRPGIGGRGAFKSRTNNRHDGIDIRAPVNTPLYACKAGTVAQVIIQTDGYGKRVILKHEEELFTHYSHLSSFAAGIEQTTPPVEVTQGQLIGYAGRTGNVPSGQLETEDHVHFGVATAERPPGGSSHWKNPVKYLNECILTTDKD